MRRLTLPFLLSSLFVLGCTPALNWREVRVGDGITSPVPLVALMPCKPEAMRREVTLAGQPLPIHMQGCEAGGATFAIAHAKALSPVLTAWQAANLAALRATTHTTQPVQLTAKLTAAPGFAPLSLAMTQTVATGLGARGQALQSHAVYFALGGQIFYAVVLAEKPSPEAVDTFFAGLTLPSAQ
jgi:hypothetical protein